MSDYFSVDLEKAIDTVRKEAELTLKKAKNWDTLLRYVSTREGITEIEAQLLDDVIKGIENY